jgi:hypothetical protein
MIENRVDIALTLLDRSRCWPSGGQDAEELHETYVFVRGSGSWAQRRAHFSINMLGADERHGGAVYPNCIEAICVY